MLCEARKCRVPLLHGGSVDDRDPELGRLYLLEADIGRL